MKSTDDLELGGASVAAGSVPVVIIGANGSGKTMLGVDLARRGALRIGARRTLDLPYGNRHPMHGGNNAAQMVSEAATNRSSSQADAHAILLELHLEEQRMALPLRRAVAEGSALPSARDVRTRFDDVRRVWHSLFPGRVLNYEADNWVVESSTSGTPTSFTQVEMSEGERQALYLTAKVLFLDDGKVLVVDEPETHLHPALARRLWDELESLRPNTRFVYITHDLQFASSRLDAVLVVCRAASKPGVVNIVPADVTVDIIGAASMPFKSARAVFCEGKSASHDYALLEAWYYGTDSAVWPVGSCDEVVRAVSVVKTSQLFGGEVVGVVDRDVRCDDELANLEGKGIHVLSVAEVEHVFAIPAVLTAVLGHLGRSSGEVDAALEALTQQLVRECGIRCNAVALEHRPV